MNTRMPIKNSRSSKLTFGVVAVAVLSFYLGRSTADSYSEVPVCNCPSIAPLSPVPCAKTIDPVKHCSHRCGYESSPAIPVQFLAPAETTDLIRSDLSARADLGLSLEFGALVWPSTNKSHPNSRFIDHLDASGLRAKYMHDPAVAENFHNLPTINYVWNGLKPLAETVGGEKVFTTVFASHVIEHVPDTITWLKDISDVLKSGGELRLAIPDKRFVFDFRKPLTTWPNLIGRYIEKRDRPSPENVYAHEQFAYPTVSDHKLLWDSYNSDTPYDNFEFTVLAHERAFGEAQRSVAEYVDVHLNNWTPESFFEHIRLMNIFKILPDLRVVSIQTVGEQSAHTFNQFFVLLRKD